MNSCFTYLLAQKVGKATYYSNRMHGRRTSDGSKYHKDSMTCAHRTYKLGTLLQVKNPRNGKTVIVRVTDRGPFSKRLMIDLSRKAAEVLDIIYCGYAMVEVSEIIDANKIPEKPQDEGLDTSFEPAYFETESMLPLVKIKRK